MNLFHFKNEEWKYKIKKLIKQQQISSYRIMQQVYIQKIQGVKMVNFQSHVILFNIWTTLRSMKNTSFYLMIKIEKLIIQYLIIKNKVIRWLILIQILDSIRKYISMKKITYLSYLNALEMNDAKRIFLIEAQLVKLIMIHL